MTKANEYQTGFGDAQPIFQMVKDLLNGTIAMRAAGVLYMPKRTMEEQGDYDARLKVSTLYPAYSETVSKMTGRAFAKPLKMNDDVPEWIRGTDDNDDESSAETKDGTSEYASEDFDGEGSNIHVWGRRAFSEGVGYGLTHCLVDCPPALKDDGSPIVTMKDQKQANVNPYAVMINPMRVLGAITDKKGKLVEFRITAVREERNMPPDFGTTCHDQVLVYRCDNNSNTTLETFEQNAKKEWVTMGVVTMNIDHIPVSTFYTNRTGYMRGKPPMLELANLNVKHWNKQSDADELIKIASVPILVEYGGGTDGLILIGSKSAVKMGDYTQSRLEFCEHTGAAIGAGRTDLDSLKQEMRDAGAKLLQPQTQKSSSGGAGGSAGNKTATQVGEEAATDNSILGTFCNDFEDFMANVLDDFAAWNVSDGTDGGTIKLQPNLDPELAAIESLTLLLQAATAGKYSDESLYEEMQKRGLVNPERPWEEELARIKQDADNAMLMNPLLAPVNPPSKGATGGATGASGATGTTKGATGPTGAAK